MAINSQPELQILNDLSLDEYVLIIKYRRLTLEAKRKFHTAADVLVSGGTLHDVFSAAGLDPDTPDEDA